MKKLLTLILIALVLSACNEKKTATEVLIETSMGNIRRVTVL